MEKIIKTLSEISDISEGIIVGYANVYNVKDSDGDISLPGSFAKTVTERKNKIKIFKNHNPDLVGVPIELDAFDAYGLKMTAKMTMDTELGRNTWAEVKFLKENGFESGLSIGGWVVKRNQKNEAEVMEYKLHEISVLTSYDPANEYSFVDLVKSINGFDVKRQDAFWTLIEKAYNERFSDNILRSLEDFLGVKEKKDEKSLEDKNKTNIFAGDKKIIEDIYKLFV